MSNTKGFHRTGKAVEWYETKYDNFKLVKSGDYRMQKGSGRSEALALAKDGMIVATWTRKCADIGLTPTFAVNSIQKLMNTKAPGWTFSPKNSDGLSIDEVKGSRAKSEKAVKDKVEKKRAKEAKKDAKPAPKRVRKPKAQAGEAEAAM